MCRGVWAGGFGEAGRLLLGGLGAGFEGGGIFVGGC
jgi:hypothetical protein